MISTTLASLLFVYLAVFMGVILAAWLRTEWLWRRRLAKANRRRIQCAICAFEFSDDTGTVLPRCPQCGSANERLPVVRL